MWLKSFWKLHFKKRSGSTFTEAYQEEELKAEVILKKIDFATKKLIVEDSVYWEKNKRDMIIAWDRSLKAYIKGQHRDSQALTSEEWVIQFWCKKIEKTRKNSLWNSLNLLKRHHPRILNQVNCNKLLRDLLPLDIFLTLQ